MSWKYIEKETPITYETGDWDGKRSDYVVAEDETGRKHIARVYEGILDGREFSEWYDSGGYFIARSIVRWFAIPA